MGTFSADGRQAGRQTQKRVKRSRGLYLYLSSEVMGGGKDNCAHEHRRNVEEKEGRENRR